MDFVLFSLCVSASLREISLSATPRRALCQTLSQPVFQELPKVPRGPLIIDRFLLRLVIGATLGAAGWFLGILLIAVVITGLQKLVTNALSGGEMLIFVALQLPRMIVFALPMAILFGSVQAFAALSRQGEAVALGAAGVSLVRMMRAPLLWALVLTAFSFGLSELLVPPLERSKDSILVSHLQAHVGAGGFRFQDPAPDEDFAAQNSGASRRFRFRFQNFETAARPSFR